MSITEDAIGSLFRFGGGWGNIGGPGIFMTKAFVSGATNAIVCGLVGATGFALVYGTAALPFVISASAGFTVGVVGFYRDAMSKALVAMERYPLILRLHLQASFPAQRFDLWESRRFRAEEFRRDWTLSNMLIASWLTATPALEVGLFGNFKANHIAVVNLPWSNYRADGHPAYYAARRRLYGTK